MTNLIELLEMKVEAQEEGYLKMSMPVTDKVKQPFGYLHGGASLALGETACSLGSAHLIDTSTHIPLGLEMNANHISSVREGVVYAEARILHQGSTTHVWDIHIKNQAGQLVSAMRGTIAIKPLKQ
ncbi:PaaI family thioesterase [Staphylococcus pseudintermedius]|nr:PaaI family thioesterase [Staphylococcus pseudintermedius]